MKQKQANGFREHLVTLRRKAEMTQETLAKEVGVSVMTVFRWEAGERQPRVEEIKRIATALKVTEAELLNGPEEAKIRFEVIFGKMEEEAIDMSGNKSAFSVFLGNEGTIGIRGAAKFATLEEIKKFIVDAGAQLEEAFRWQQERGAIPAMA